MIIDDILKVVYAPHKVFKDIVTNPKYLGALIVLLLFIGLEVGYEYSQFSKTYTEQTTPSIDQLATFTNASFMGNDGVTTVWRSSSNVALSNNFNDFYNYSVYVAGFGLPTTDSRAYFKLFGNSSLEMSANNTSSLTAALDIVSALGSINETLVAQKVTPLSSLTVDCSPSAFQNLSITLKQVEPQVAPQSAVITLYSNGDTNYYTYDLTTLLSNTSNIGQWTNITLTLGPNAAGWTSSGAPEWGNVTALKLDFTYPTSSNINIEVGALFFHGQYLTPVQYNATGVALQFLQLFSLQFLITWFILAALIYLFCRLLKGTSTLTITWKPLFVAIGFAMFIMVIRALVSVAATFTSPNNYYPYDLSLGIRFDPFAALYYPMEAIGTLPASSAMIFNNINASTQAFRTIVTAISIASYVWLGAVTTWVIGALRPDLSMMKRIAISSASLIIVSVVLVFLVGTV